MTQSPLISVIVVNYNGAVFLPACLESLQQQRFRDFEIIVIDNASEDSSRDWLGHQSQPNLRVALNEDNRGFAGGANQGAAMARGVWIAMLNPDTVAAPDWLDEVVKGIARHPDARHFASLQLEGTAGMRPIRAEDAAPLARVDGAGDCWSVYGFAWRACSGHAVQTLPEDDRLCFSACGASAIYHRATFMDFNGFDERFFCYLEDVDLGYRLQRQGHDCVWLARAVVSHADGGTTKALPGFREFHTARNRVWTLWKNTPTLLLPAVIFGWAMMSLFLALRGIGTEEPKMMWKGYRAAFADLPDRRRPTPRQLGLGSLLGRLSWSPLDHRAHNGRFRTTGL